MFFEYIKAIIYGITEGITEWLPISSTGHLILLERILPLSIASELGEEFYAQYINMFDVVVQLGAILAVVFIYFKHLNPFCAQRKTVISLWIKLAVATLPAAIIGFLCDKLCEYFLNRSLDSILFKPQIVAASLIVYGIFFIIVECLSKNCDTRQRETVSLKYALAIGFFQALAIIPGTSRSGATVLGARILGLKRYAATEFSFFAAIPVISAASLLKSIDFFTYTYSSQTSVPTQALLALFLAGAVAFIVSLLTIKLLTDFVKKHSFTVFGIYRIALGISVLLIFR